MAHFIRTCWFLCSLFATAFAQGNTLSTLSPIQRSCTFNGEAVFCTHQDAMTRLHQDIFGDDETYTTWAYARTPPTRSSPGEKTEPVLVKVQLYLERLKIDSREQEVTLKWWLRTTWIDNRISWTPSDYTYLAGGSTAAIQAIVRTEGFWKPDLVLYEAFSHFQASSFGETNWPAEIHNTGSIYYAVSQEVKVHFAPQMNMANFPFDEEMIQSTPAPVSALASAAHITAPDVVLRSVRARDHPSYSVCYLSYW